VISREPAARRSRDSHRSSADAAPRPLASLAGRRAARRSPAGPCRRGR
jgi:hypothetical protein